MKEIIRHTEDRGSKEFDHEINCVSGTNLSAVCVEQFKVIFNDSSVIDVSESRESGTDRIRTLKHSTKSLSFIMTRLIFSKRLHLSLCLFSAVHSCGVGNGGCEHFCVQKTAGHFQCRCRPGHRLDVDGKHCKCESDRTDVGPSHEHYRFLTFRTHLRSQFLSSCWQWDWSRSAQVETWKCAILCLVYAILFYSQMPENTNKCLNDREWTGGVTAQVI